MATRSRGQLNSFENRSCGAQWVHADATHAITSATMGLLTDGKLP